MELKVGQIIVAHPHLPDDAYARSVILLLVRNTFHTVGVNVAKFMEVIDEQPFCGAKVFDGGEVIGRNVALHKSDLAVPSSEVLGDSGYAVTILSQDAKFVVQPAGLINKDGVETFVGHVGWGRGQLEGEMLLGAWQVTSASLESILSAAPEARWEVAAKGADFNSMLIGTGNMIEGAIGYCPSRQ